MQIEMENRNTIQLTALECTTSFVVELLLMLSLFSSSTSCVGCWIDEGDDGWMLPVFSVSISVIYTT